MCGFSLANHNYYDMVIFKMNDEVRLDSRAIKAWLMREDRKLSFLSKRLKCSLNLVDKMVNHGHIPNAHRMVILADLMGVEVGKLLLPKEGRKTA